MGHRRRAGRPAIGTLIWYFAKRADVLAAVGRQPFAPPGWYPEPGRRDRVLGPGVGHEAIGRAVQEEQRRVARAGREQRWAPESDTAARTAVVGASALLKATWAAVMAGPADVPAMAIRVGSIP